jgi:cell division control protein 6
MALGSSSKVFRKIAETITPKARQSQMESTPDLKKFLENELTSSKKWILLVLDEIDQLESKCQEVLYTLFEWPYLANSKLILVGIANALDLTDRILPRVTVRPTFSKTARQVKENDAIFTFSASRSLCSSGN